jgi:hypothetical protein
MAREIPAERFELELAWPAPWPEPPAPRSHLERIRDDAPGPYRRPELEAEADSEGGETE